MTSKTLTPLALYEQVAEQLRQRIFRRELEPGAWIDELKIAEEYGISRTPLREALKVLAAEGLVTMKLRRGAYVTEVSRKDISDVYRLLSLLEADAAAEVAGKATDEQLQRLQQTHEELKRNTADAERFFALNESFHMQILDIADNRWRNQLVADLRKVMKLNRHKSLFKQGRIEDSLAEHEAIMQALLKRDPKIAMSAVQQHFSNGLDAAI
ncbi:MULTISPECIES: GntR family transcriptional regulator [Comamonas]|mgnify:FL=1|uniref:GntR family transcriptional regulator n=2 Tax=root TaxID=1 RepID=A0A096F4F7_9BURK|nr:MULTISPECIES: GntR family transcriptional regulator [Comamonas]ACY33073.1 transcriptional regulator, GntR family [Comamonas thiooxydans]EFI61941.1 transcriptional regulator, GntR family protein [Comamonas thiooxydans]KGG81799.1 GntR family transcriptional regulator [Comamonas thiooxydans]KGG89154.1 GntR family transcriptional regulator [Comamonas thiooxydans]KGG93577.1 GntR family transcriptional regulator [Comamonas thiooxydans]